MMSDFNPTYLWAFVVIGGPILLIIGILLAKANNRRSREAERRTEEATRRNYEEQDRIDKANEG